MKCMICERTVDEIVSKLKPNTNYNFQGFKGKLICEDCYKKFSDEQRQDFENQRRNNPRTNDKK